MEGRVGVGTLVRIELQGRRVGGWVVELDSQPPEGTNLRPLAKVTGWGPPPDLVDLAAWAAHRWAGRQVALLRTASPPRAVTAVPPPLVSRDPVPFTGDTLADGLRRAHSRNDASESGAFPPTGSGRRPCCGCRPPPTGSRSCWPPVVGATRSSSCRRSTRPRSSAGGCAGPGCRLPSCPTSGRRPGAGPPWSAPAARRGRRWSTWPSVLVLDEHDEAYKQEQTPAWHARDVVVERAAPCRCALRPGLALPDARGAGLGPAGDAVPVRRAPGLAHRRRGRPAQGGHRSHRALLDPPGRPAAGRRSGGVRPQPQGPGPPARLRHLRRDGHLRALRRGPRPARCGHADLPPLRAHPPDRVRPLRRDPAEAPAGRGQPGRRGAAGPGPRPRWSR